MLLTGADPPQPTALSWPFLNAGKYLKIFIGFYNYILVFSPFLFFLKDCCHYACEAKGLLFYMQGQA